jgi:hypothetical protein
LEKTPDFKIGSFFLPFIQSFHHQITPLEHKVRDSPYAQHNSPRRRSLRLPLDLAYISVIKKYPFFACLKHAFVRNFRKSFQNYFQKGEKKRRKVPFLGCFFIKNRTKINFFSLIISKIVKKCKKSFERYCQIKKR